MLSTLRNAWKVPELRKRFLWTIFLVAIFRIGIHIPVPGIDTSYLSSMTNSGGLLGFYNLISGGALSKFSIFALSVSPYINASIIMQLLTIAIPSLEQLSKEGEEGRKKIAEITRYLTVALALIESTAMIIGFANQGIFNTDSISYGSMSSLRKWGVVLTGIIAMTAGSAVLMWIGEQITEKGVGNGISIVLTINIISGMPSDISNLFTTFVTGEGKSIGMRILSALIIIGVIVGIVVLVVILQAATRNIAVQMSQKVQGRRQVGGQQSNIPLKVNTAGVMPVIFASSLMQFPVIIAQLFGKSYEWTRYLSSSYWCRVSAPKYSLGLILYIVLLIIFAYFYTSITFNPIEVADNLKKAGGVIPGITPGKSTSDYLNNILNYIVFVGAVGLLIVALIPIMCTGFFNASVSFGGTSVIIIVGVVLETLKQIESQMVNRYYKGFLSE